MVTLRNFKIQKCFDDDAVLQLEFFWRLCGSAKQFLLTILLREMDVASLAATSLCALTCTDQCQSRTHGHLKWCGHLNGAKQGAEKRQADSAAVNRSLQIEGKSQLWVLCDPLWKLYSVEH